MRIRDVRILNGGDKCLVEVTVTVRATSLEIEGLDFHVVERSKGIFDIHFSATRAEIKTSIDELVQNSRDCVWLALLGKKIYERLGATYRE